MPGFTIGPRDWLALLAPAIVIAIIGWTHGIVLAAPFAAITLWTWVWRVRRYPPGERWRVRL